MQWCGAGGGSALGAFQQVVLGQQRSAWGQLRGGMCAGAGGGQRGVGIRGEAGGLGLARVLAVSRGYPEGPGKGCGSGGVDFTTHCLGKTIGAGVAPWSVSHLSSPLSPCFPGAAYPPGWRGAQGASDAWQFSDGSSRALKF